MSMTGDSVSGSTTARSVEELAAEQLEYRYLRLLRVYPAAYRRERGPEMIGTLLDAAAPGQTRPTWREAYALVIGGVRARAGVNVRRPLATTLRMSLAYAGVLGLVVNVSTDVGNMVSRQRFLPQYVLLLSAMAAAIVLVWVRRPRWVLALLPVLPYVRWRYNPMPAPLWPYLAILLFSGLPFLLIGFAGRRWDPRPAAPLSVLLGVCGVLFMLASPELAHPGPAGSSPAVWWEIGGVLLLAYSLIDGRVAGALALVMVSRVAVYAAMSGGTTLSARDPLAIGAMNVPIVVPIAAGIVLGILGSRRQAMR